MAVRPMGCRSPAGVGDTGCAVAEGARVAADPAGEGVDGVEDGGARVGVGGVAVGGVGAGAGGGVTTFLGYTRISVCRSTRQ